MDEQGYRFGVGVLVVASLVIAVILIMFFGAAPNIFKHQYRTTIRFNAAPGVGTDTPVRKNGVQIGRVASVKLLKGAQGVELTLELDAEHEVYVGEQPRIGKGSFITGDAVVEFVPLSEFNLVEKFDGQGGSPANGLLDENEMQLSRAILKDGDFITGGIVAPDPLDTLLDMQSSFATTLASIENAGNQVTALALDVRTMIGGSDGELRRITVQAEQTIANFNQTLDAIESVFADPNLKNSINVVSQRLPELVNEAERVMQQTQSTLAAYEGVGRAAEEAMQNVSEFTQPLGDQGERIVGDVLRTVNNLDSLLGDLRKVSVTVNQVATRINNGQGTFAKLMDDDQLYYSVINTLENVETLTRRLQPVVEDARIFSDKLARDPASLIDVRGALTGRPRGGIK
ncbi:MlaD family protein [Aureliella helgolandensis]|uniref:Mce related protein n=1 Tax=Aureliella helgolandensis TaxID=2527968 RepID=A0A518GGA8_9BACT|nr:MlaD family protein [Aureliella helgolandensis]QDV27629.1 mce related protein [Aureliella helgolandensis]